MRLWSKIGKRRRRRGRMKQQKSWLDGVVARIKKTSRRNLRKKVRTGEAKKNVVTWFDYRLLVRSKLFGTVLMIVVVYMIFLTGREALGNFYQNKQIARVEAENNKIRQKNEETKYLLEYYKTETYAELEAREHLNMKKKGEKVAIIPVDLNDGNAVDEIEETKVQSRSNYKKWWDFLFADISNLPD